LTGTSSTSFPFRSLLGGQNKKISPHPVEREPGRHPLTLAALLSVLLCGRCSRPDRLGGRSLWPTWRADSCRCRREASRCCAGRRAITTISAAGRLPCSTRTSPILLCDTLQPPTRVPTPARFSLAPWRALSVCRPGAVFPRSWRQGPAPLSGASQGLRSDDPGAEDRSCEGPPRPRGRAGCTEASRRSGTPARRTRRGPGLCATCRSGKAHLAREWRRSVFGREPPPHRRASG
jgi:hypothetical protein